MELVEGVSFVTLSIDFGSFASKVDFGGKRVSSLIRVTSWIVPFIQKNKDDLPV